MIFPGTSVKPRDWLIVQHHALAEKPLRDVSLLGRSAILHLLTGVQENPINSPYIPAHAVRT